MTNKEAIKILQNDGCCQDCTFGGYPCKLVGCETHQALDLAIKALEERPQGDLISRTWLKEHKFTTQVCNGVEIEDVDVVAVATIDNAPTVEYTFEEAFQKTVCEQRLYCPNKRPQGEWIEGTQGYYCSECDVVDQFYFEHGFCPHCGADMRGGRE